MFKLCFLFIRTQLQCYVNLNSAYQFEYAPVLIVVYVDHLLG